MSVQSLDNEQGIHVSHSIIFDGNVTAWDTKTIDLSSISNEASTFDNKRRISDVTARISDIDGVIWDALGHGTTAFGKGFKVITTIGGTYGQTTFGQVEGYGFTGTVGGTQFTTHIGSVVEVQKSGRSILIRSKNNMERLNEMTFKFPLDLTNHLSIDHSLNYKDFSFCESNIDTTEWLAILDQGGWDRTDDKVGGKFAVYGGFAGDDNTGTDDGGLYSGTVVTVPSTYTNMNKAWHREHTKLQMSGTYIGAFSGTIGDIDTANLYGFSSLADAKSSIVTDGQGTYYQVNKLRVKWPQGTAQSFGTLYPASSVTMTSDYTSILEHLIAGRFIYRRFATTDMDSVSFGKSTSIGAFSAFEGTVLPREDKVIPHIDDIVSSTQAMFSVNNNNKFEYLAYGPVEIVGQLGTILQSDVLESANTNRKEDAYNAFEVHYKYNADQDAYGSFVSGTLPDWSEDEERLLKIESKWMHNNNEAVIFKDQVKGRYKNTSPVIMVTTTLNKAQTNIGELLTVTDVNSGMSEKVVQVRKFNKDFPNAKNIKFEMLDADNLYYGRGWAFWGTETNLTTAVTSSSRSGWSDGALYTGTVNNINEAVYGTAFKFW